MGSLVAVAHSWVFHLFKRAASVVTSSTETSSRLVAAALTPLRTGREKVVQTFRLIYVIQDEAGIDICTMLALCYVMKCVSDC